MTFCSEVTVLSLVVVTKKPFGHYVISRILSLRLSRRERNICGLDSIFDQISECHSIVD